MTGFPIDRIEINAFRRATKRNMKLRQFLQAAMGMAIRLQSLWIPIFLVREEPVEDPPENRLDTASRERSPTRGERMTYRPLEIGDDPFLF